MMQEALEAAVAGRDLDDAVMEAAIDEILGGTASAARIAALLVALRIKGESADELAAAARVMRRHAVAVELEVEPPILDTCGTGGDGSGSFNISTVSAIVVAACGVTVAKHGNRAASSRAGSADVLEALGVSLELSPPQIAHCIERLGIGFMFARAHHPAMRHAGPVRAELKLRTLFNFLGPLSNPAGATHQLLGVGDGSKLETMAHVLSKLGASGAWVVHGDGGLDEVALSGATEVAALEDGRVRCFSLGPEDFGVPRAPAKALRGGDARDNAATARAILDGEPGPKRDAVVINAAAALCAAGVEREPQVAARRVAEAIDSGAARDKLAAWAAFRG